MQHRASPSRTSKPSLALTMRPLAKSSVTVVSLLGLFACSQAPQDNRLPENQETKPLVTESMLAELDPPSQEDAVLLVTGLENPEALLANAQDRGLQAEGKSVIRLEGPRRALAELEIAAAENPLVLPDSPLSVERPETLEAPDEKALFLASEDFGLPQFRKSAPLVDGRGTTIGVIDDGVSLFHSGLTTTTDGKRKIKAFRSASPELNIVLTDEDTVTVSPHFLTASEAGQARYTKVWFGEIAEPTLIADTSGASKAGGAPYADWNENGTQDRYSVAVGALRDNGFEICVDLNNNQLQDDNECVTDFTQSGQFIFWANGSGRNLAGIFDPESATLSLAEGELPGDGHGEGVASVAAGHQIGGSFDGVAPGAQILDFDLSTRSGEATQAVYSIGTFLRALEWVGSQGAEVANISYSLFYQSVAGQLFMEKALSQIVKDYNLVISMSAGNNGPGLSSLNRRALYPDDVLVAGAYVGQKLYEYVHGVTGLPAQGRVVSYSSRGPGPFGGLGPTVISPLASLSHAPPGEGYRAFSGTSSASPALAGLAANVISALRLEGLAVHADLVVQAIRLSGKPLKNVPFVEQGNGLPQIGAALQIYRQLLDKRLPSRIDVRLPTGPVAESNPSLQRDSKRQARGLFLRLSQIGDAPQLSYEAILTGVFGGSKTADGRGTDTLVPLTVESSEDWISAPARSFVSEGTSRITLTIDLERAKETLASGHEIFGEVHLLARDSTMRLATIPFTVINDSVLSANEDTLTVTETLRTEESKRVHIFVQPGVRALALTPNILRGTGDNLLLSVFDPRGVQIGSRFRRPQGTTLIPVERSGWHQIALTKYRGGSESLRASVEIQGLSLSLGQGSSDPILDKATGQLLIQNHNSREAIEGALELRIARESISQSVQSLSPSGNALFEFNLRGFERDVNLKVSALSASEWSYFEGYGHSCIWDLRDGNENQLAKYYGNSGTVLNLKAFEKMQSPIGSAPANHESDGFEHLVRKVSIRCWIFEDTGATSLENAKLSFEARARYTSNETLEKWSEMAGDVRVRLQPGFNTITLPSLLQKQLAESRIGKVEIRLRSLDESPSEGVSLGQLSVR